MKSKPLTSPAGQYEPELLLLAPGSGEDAYTLSLVAQFLELGVAIELDADWRLPTAPPRDLSAYRACLFPESAREKYDKDLNSFYRAGGFLGYFKYYPVSTGPDLASVHHFIQSYGRDAYCYALAQAMLEGAEAQNSGFLRLMESRPVHSIIAEYRAQMFGRYAGKIDVWRAWGDPQYTMVLGNLHLAERLKDGDWLRLVHYFLQKLSDSKAEPLTRRTSENQLEDTVDCYVPIMASLLMQSGEKYGRPEWTATGVELTRFFLNHCQVREGMVIEKWMRVIWSECMAACPALFWLSRVTGEKEHVRAAETTVRQVAAITHNANGLWHHWADRPKRCGAFWSRGTQWPLLWMTQSLLAVDPASEVAAFMQQEIVKTYDALEKFQHPDRGMWHLVIDEPDTRIESSGSAAVVYCYDQLREHDMISTRYAGMIERAFRGLKRLYYRGGLAATCRGTALGNEEFYRTRPLGYAINGLFMATLGNRMEQDGDSES